MDRESGQPLAIRPFPIHAHAGEPARIVIRQLSGRLLDGEQVGGRVNADHLSILSRFDSSALASARISDDIVDLIATGPGPFGSRHVLALYKNSEAVIIWRDSPIGFQFLADCDVQLVPGSIVWRDDKCLFRRVGVAPGDGANAFSGIGNFRDATLFLKSVQRGRNLTCCEHFDSGFEFWVSLADDLIEFGRAHSGLL